MSYRGLGKAARLEAARDAYPEGYGQCKGCRARSDQQTRRINVLEDEVVNLRQIVGKLAQQAGLELSYRPEQEARWELRKARRPEPGLDAVCEEAKFAGPGPFGEPDEDLSF